MGRLHLFELSDQTWFPDGIRTAMTGYLEYVAKRGGHGLPIARVLTRMVDRSGEKRIVDLGSGAGGPMIQAFGALRAMREDVELTLSDLYPNHEALALAARAVPGAIRVSEAPVDATRVPPSLAGIRTLMNSYHHLRPESARAVLQDAVTARQPIVVVEMLRRHPAILALNLLSWVGVLRGLPFVRPLRPSWLLWTYVVPVIPLTFTWDAIVSTLRIYSERELRALIDSLDGHEEYDWDFEYLKLWPSPIASLALSGTPRARASSRSGDLSGVSIH